MTSSLQMARGGRSSRVVRAVEGESLRSPFLHVKQGDSADYPGAAAGHRSAASRFHAPERTTRDANLLCVTIVAHE